jgi:hypothetical protein
MNNRDWMWIVVCLLIITGHPFVAIFLAVILLEVI